MNWTNALTHVIKSLPVIFLGAMEIAMAARAICSWFMPDGENGFYLFLVGVTEPLIAPVASLFETMGWGENSMIDMPFIFTMIAISVIQTLLSAFM